MYTAAYEKNKALLPDGVTTAQKTDKVDTICDAVRLALINLDENK